MSTISLIITGPQVANTCAERYRSLHEALRSAGTNDDAGLSAWLRAHLGHRTRLRPETQLAITAAVSALCQEFASLTGLQLAVVPLHRPGRTRVRAAWAVSGAVTLTPAAALYASRHGPWNGAQIG